MQVDPSASGLIIKRLPRETKIMAVRCALKYMLIAEVAANVKTINMSKSKIRNSCNQIR